MGVGEGASLSTERNGRETRVWYVHSAVITGVSNMEIVGSSLCLW